MTITRERFEAAMTPAQYIAAMEQNREQFEANLAATRITDEERSFFTALPSPLNVLVLSENWCPDCTTNVPIIVRLAQETGTLNVRLLKRDGNEEIANQYTLADGRNHIPTYILLDENLRELGHFLERPEAVTERLAGVRAAWYAAHPALDPSAPLSEAPEPLRAQFRDEYGAARRNLWDLEQREIIAAFRAIAERALTAAAR
jgi:hypothetical protein